MIYLILLLGIILRLVSLNQSLWLDEATSGWLARDFSFADILTKFSPGDFHPPLYYLVLKVWSFVFGTNEVGLRSLSVAAGVASIYVVYLIAREIRNSNVLKINNFGFRNCLEFRIWNLGFAEVSALLLATSGLHLYYSQEARMYGMATFLVAWLIYSFIKKKWVLFSILLIAVGMTDYVSLFIIPVFWITDWKDRKKLALSHIPLVAVFSVWMPILIKQFGVGLGVGATYWWQILGTVTSKNIVLIPVKFMIGRISFENQWIYGAIIASLGFLFSWLLFRSTRLRRGFDGQVRNFYLLWIWLTVPVVVGVLVSLKIPTLSYFRFLFVLPAFYLLVAAGLSSFKRWPGVIAAALVLTVNLVSSGVYLFNPKFQREDWRGLVAYIEHTTNNIEQSSVVIFPTYSQMEAFRYYDEDGRIKINGPALIEERYDIIWLMRYAQPIFDQPDQARIKIEDLGYIKQEEKDFNGVVVWKYQR